MYQNLICQNNSLDLSNFSIQARGNQQWGNQEKWKRKIDKQLGKISKLSKEGDKIKRKRKERKKKMQLLLGP